MPGIDTTGALRLQIDVDALRDLGNGLAWAPDDLLTQQGEPVGACTRGLLERVEIQLAEAGLTALVGHELEFLLVTPTVPRSGRNGWTGADCFNAGVNLLSSDLMTTFNALDFSERTRRPLGDEIVDATEAVRRHELAVYGDADPVDVA